MTATPRRTLAAAAAGVLIAITGSACSAGSSDDSSAGSSSDSSVASGSSDTSGFAASKAEPGAAPAAGSRAQDVAQTPVEQQQVVSTGTVRLDSRDVAAAAADVRRIVTQYAGSLAQDATDTTRDGTPRHAHLVVRVPVASFEDALGDFEAVGTLVSSDSTTQDVTTQVLDTDVRVAAERRSIERIQVLFDQATSIADIVKIENELSTRQADLASLEQQQRYLRDQTALSTIDVTIDRTTATTAPPKHDDTSGFTAGLAAGWGGLKTFGVVAATVLGALLPWLVVLGLLGVPSWTLVRRTRRRRAPAV